MISLAPNQCKPNGGGCSLCGVDGDFERCFYGDKSNNKLNKKCMYFKFDEFCDNWKAQINADKDKPETMPETNKATVWDSYIPKNAPKGGGEIIKVNRSIN